MYVSTHPPKPTSIPVCINPRSINTPQTNSIPKTNINTKQLLSHQHFNLSETEKENEKEKEKGDPQSESEGHGEITGEKQKKGFPN